MYSPPAPHSVIGSRPSHMSRGTHHHHHQRASSAAEVDMFASNLGSGMQLDWKDPWAVDQTPRSFGNIIGGGYTSKPLPPPKSSFSIFPSHSTLLQPEKSIWTSPAGTSPWRLRRGEHKQPPTIATDTASTGFYPHEIQPTSTSYTPLVIETTPPILPIGEHRPTSSRRSTASSISSSSTSSSPASSLYSHASSSPSSTTISTTSSPPSTSPSSTTSPSPTQQQWTRSQLQLPTPDPSKKPPSSQRIRPHQYCAWCGQLGHSKPTCTDLTSALHTGKVRLEGGKIALALGPRGGPGDREETIPYPHGRGTLRDWVKRRYKELGVDISFGGDGSNAASGGAGVSGGLGSGSGSGSSSSLASSTSSGASSTGVGDSRRHSGRRSNHAHRGSL